jgi:hypothetical protein
MTGSQWQRIGGIAGLVFVLLFLGNLFTPSTPDGDDASSTFAPAIADDRTGHVFSIYLDGLGMVFFLAFLASLYGLLRRAEPEAGPSLLALVGGLVLSGVVLVSSGVYFALVEAADEGREPAAVRALFELDSAIFIPAGFALDVLYAGIALSSLSTRSLPGWLGWTAAAFAAIFAVSMLGLFSDDDEGGVLGIVFFMALLAQFLWIVAASIVMLGRGRRETRVSRQAVTA